MAKVRRAYEVLAPIADQLLAHFREQDLICEVGGSFRRKCAFVGDLDIVVRCESLHRIELPSWLVFTRLGEQVAQAQMLMPDGGVLTVDVWAATERQWGAFLWYITGSKELNVAMRRMASVKGLKLSQFGLFNGDTQIDDGTERGVAAALGMDWIDPEKRSWGTPTDVPLRKVRVASSSGDGSYLVAEFPDKFVCTCPHHTFRRVECKHIRQVRDSLAVI